MTGYSVCFNHESFAALIVETVCVQNCPGFLKTNITTYVSHTISQSCLLTFIFATSSIATKQGYYS